jgi:hypothetical protein
MAADTYPREAMKGIFWCQWTYWCSLALAIVSYRYYPPSSTRTLVVLTPVLPALLIVAVTYWVYQDCDEYIRFRILRSVAITAIVVAFGTLAWFILELFGYPRLSALWVNLVGWSLFNVQMLYILFRSR